MQLTKTATLRPISRAVLARSRVSVHVALHDAGTVLRTRWALSGKDADQIRGSGDLRKHVATRRALPAPGCRSRRSVPRPERCITARDTQPKRSSALFRGQRANTAHKKKCAKRGRDTTGPCLLAYCQSLAGCSDPHQRYIAVYHSAGWRRHWATRSGLSKRRRTGGRRR